MTKQGQKAGVLSPPGYERRFDKDIRSWFRGEYGIGNGWFELDPNFHTWAKETVKNVESPLKELFFRYGIFPGNVLTILANLMINQRRQATRNKIRSAQTREKDAALLKKAAKLLDGWCPVLSWDLKLPLDTDSNALGKKVREVAEVIQGLGPVRRHRPREDALRECAVALAKHFRSPSSRGHPLYQYIGELLHAAFPKEWGAAGDKGDAVKKLIKRS